MRTPAMRKLSGLSLALLLLVPALPAIALDPIAVAGALDLELESALEVQDSALGISTEAESSNAMAETAAAGISLSEVRAEAWALDEGDDDPAEAMRPGKKKRLGRWLKKRWYVPLIAAVVLGATLDSGDGDADGEDD